MSRVIRESLHFLARNSLFCLAFAAGLAVRIVTILGFPPAIWYGGDSSSYLSTGVYLTPATSRLSGYGVFLFLLRPFHSFALVTTITHLMGLSVGVMIYALLRRYRLPRWGATLAALPVLLDVYQIQLEHEILASALFGFLVMAAITLIMWWPQERPLWATAAAALLLGLAATTWPVGIPVIILLLAYLLLRRAGWRAVTAAVIAAAFPLLLYLDWFDANYHRAAFNNAEGIFLWSRTMTFANCAIIKPPPDERPLCSRIPIRERPTANAFIWEADSPINAVPGRKFGPAKNSLALHFALRAIAAQPFSYARNVFDDFWLTFSWNRPHHPSVRMVDRYQFAFAGQNWIKPGRNTRLLYQEQRLYTGGSLAPTRVVPPFAGFMQAYQRYVFLRGTILLILLIIGLGGIGRSLAGRRWRRPSSWGGPVLLPWAIGLAMLLVPPATADYSDRYTVPAMPVVCLAAALAFASLARQRQAVGLPPVPATGQAAGPAEPGDNGNPDLSQPDDTAEALPGEPGTPAPAEAVASETWKPDRSG